MSDTPSGETRADEPVTETPPANAASPHLLAGIGATFGTQAVAVITFLTVPIMATEIAPAFGVAAKDIGIFMSIVFASAMVFSAASGSLIRRYGGIRTIQLGMTFSACCLLLVLAGSMPLLLLAAILVGVGYGSNTPAGTHVLARVTPPRARGFVFSLKQSGAPLGGLIAGFLVPALVISIGWRGALGVTVVLALLAVIAIQPLRRSLDDDRDPRTRLGFVSPWGAIRAVLRNPPLRRLIAVAFCLTTIQAIVLTFLIIILVESLGLEFTLAGAVFATSQAGGAGLRILSGWIADRALGARGTLIVLGFGSTIALLALTMLTPATPLFIIMIISVIVGTLSFGWNGVFLAEVVNLAQPAEVGSATGGALFFLYGGIVAGPAALSLMVTVFGEFAGPLRFIAVVTLLASANLLWRVPR